MTIIFVTYIDVTYTRSGSGLYECAVLQHQEGWSCKDDQSQKVTESLVEINFTLMKVIAPTEEGAALERAAVLLSGILVTH
jgi:hypothetical protein